MMDAEIVRTELAANRDRRRFEFKLDPEEAAKLGARLAALGEAVSPGCCGRSSGTHPE